MIVLGIDPGLVNTGWGVVSQEEGISGEQIKAYGCIKTRADCFLPQRLALIYEKLMEVIRKYKPDNMAVEKIFYAKNVKTTLFLGQARGIVLLAGYQAGLSISEYTALQVKQSLVGYGRAEKKQIQNMLKNVLKLKEIPRPEDAADALAVAICHLNSKKYFQKIKCQ
jgi:crossover junction endodeoxyribonuclease RuvC